MSQIVLGNRPNSYFENPSKAQIWPLMEARSGEPIYDSSPWLAVEIPVEI